MLWPNSEILGPSYQAVAADQSAQFLFELIWIISRLIIDLSRASSKNIQLKNSFKVEIGADFSLVSLPQVSKQ